MNPLQVSPDLALPVVYVTERVVMLARPEQGKTYLASVLAEEMLESKLLFVVIDTMGVFWGLRSSRDGKKAGYPITILGGDRGDVPLEAAGGGLAADLLMDTGVPIILDVSHFEPKDQKRFVADFAGRLYQLESKAKQPIHIFLDEADAYCPQTPQNDKDGLDSICLGRIKRIIQYGRNFGLGITMMTQRPQNINKTATDLCSTLVCFQITGHKSRAVVDDWVSQHGTTEQRKEFLETLASLKVGECWVWSPTKFKLFRRIKVRERRTFDSSATPEVGVERVEPKVIARVELQEFQRRMAESIEKAKSEDPNLLRAKIADLQKQIARAQAATLPVPKPIIQTVEVPVLPPDQVDRLAKIAEDVIGVAQDITGLTKDLTEAANGIRALLQHHIGETNKKPSLPAGPIDRVPSRRASAGYNEEGSPSRRKAATEQPVVSTTHRLGKGEQTVLSVLAQWPQGLTHNRLAFMAGYSAKASTLGVILANLRRASLVEPGQPIRATEEGLAAAGGVQELPSGQELLDHWLNHPRMGEGERKVLRALIDFYPNEVSNAELCERTGYSPTASTMGVIISKLRKLGLVEMGVRRVPDEFMESIR